MNRTAHSGKSLRCIIHVGMHKTGSTSIQRSLDGFTDEQFVYAKLGTTSNHSLPIYSLFATNPERHRIHQVFERNSEAIQRYISDVREMLDASVRTARRRTLLISGEDVARLPECDLLKLRDYFDERFSELMIVAYVRPPGAFMASSFQERVKNGGMKVFEPKRMYRKYRENFSKLDGVFGPDRIQLWKFDSETFPQRDVVRHFCKALGIALPEKQIVRANESLSRRAVSALYTYNKFENRSGRNLLNEIDTKVAERLFVGDKFRLAPDVIRAVLSKKRSDINWMEARLGQSLMEELGRRQPGDVRNERDLLRPDPEFVAQLVKELGTAAPAGIKGETPSEVAQLLETLRVGTSTRFGWFGKHARPDDRTKSSGQASDRSTNGIFKQADEAGLDNLLSAPAKSLVASAFDYIRGRLARSEQDRVSFDQFGSFHIVKSRKQERRKGAHIRFRYRPAAVGRSRSPVPATDLIGEILRTAPHLMHGLGPDKARDVLAAVFSQINQRVTSTKAGVIACPGLGRFRVIRQRPRSSASRSGSRIIFRPEQAHE